jgi:hypothetical protein
MSKKALSKKAKPKKKRVRLPEYQGDLAEPIVEPPLPFGLLREVLKEEAERRAIQRQAAKLEKLFEHFSIDPTSKHRWLDLAISLAVKHVPGMRVSFVAKSKGGRPRKWKAGGNKQLLLDAKRVQQGRTMPYADVVRELLKTERWRDESPENLETRYREARRDEEERQKAKALFGSDEEAVLAALTPLGPTD